MELESLKLKNFRQFRNSEIKFSRDNNHNVTVIHGDNGSGKTTLLNAFTWVLYGKVDFETGEDQLVNEGVMADAPVDTTVEVSVKLAFYHEDSHYRATRTISYQKTHVEDLIGESEDTTINLEYKNGGEYKSVNNPNTRLEQIIPERLSSLFFFDGEDIGELAESANKDRIKEAIRNIMGLTILERSIRHLDEVSRRFRSDVKKTGSDKLAALIDEENKIEAQLEQKRSQLEKRKEREENIEKRINAIGKELENLDESHEIEEELQRVEHQRDNLIVKREEVQKNVRAKITKGGVLAFALPAIRDTAADLDELRKNDLLGSGVSEEFLNKLLERERCICGRPLDEGSKYYERVESMETTVDASGISDQSINTASQFRIADSHYGTLRTDLTTLLEQRKELNEQIDAKTEQIDELEAKLGSMETRTLGQQSPAELQQEREEKRQTLKDNIKDIGRIEDKIDELEEQSQGIETRIDNAREEKAETELARRRWKASVKTWENLESSFRKLQQTVRRLANDTVSERFDSIAHKDGDDLHAVINEDFELEGRKRVGDQYERVEMSRGERQIASLTFIGSLVSIARQRYEKHAEDQYFSGGIYPIVMDSPFGALDNTHRRHISREIPKLAKQVIVLATDSQWDGPVSEELEPRAGIQYRLDFDNGEESEKYPQTNVVIEQNLVASERTSS
ncbi:AAA family ATPase [Haladaptatus sp. CMSO5]|uniref:AAA family ATPase n=1 Tax=Haladaptatus sp. CMSO5 TaxID=3120514 RepID=UPI002FCE2BDB